MKEQNKTKWDSILESLTRTRVYTIFYNKRAFLYGKIIILNKNTGQALSMYFGENDKITIYRLYQRHELKEREILPGAKLKEILGHVSEFFNLNDVVMGSNVYNLRYQKFIKYHELSRPKKIIYVDLDGVVVDIVKEYEKYKENNPSSKKDLVAYIDMTEDGFLNAEPIEYALRSIKRLETKYDVFILSTAPWKNISSWGHKRLWVEKHLPTMRKKLILSNNKDLLIGDYLIDDRLRNGAPEFNGTHIHIFSKKYPSWDSVLNKLKV